MSIDSLSAHLLRLDIFQGLTPLQITEIVRRAERVVYKPGQLMMVDGEPGDAGVIVVSGEAIRTSGTHAERTEEPIEPGSLLGETAMLVEVEFSSTIVARTPVRALRIARQTMLEMMAEDPGMAEHFIAHTVQRLKRVADELRHIDALFEGGLRELDRIEAGAARTIADASAASASA